MMIKEDKKMMMSENIEKIYSELEGDLFLREKINSMISERLEEVGLKMLNLYANLSIKSNTLTNEQLLAVGVFFMSLCDEILDNEMGGKKK